MNTLTWLRIPSVRVGGKPYFYFAQSGEHTYRVAWDRLAKGYSFALDDEHVSYHVSFARGKQAAERTAATIGTLAWLLV